MPLPENIGRYRILSELGHGAMGSVFKAEDPMMDRTVAIKTILASALTGPLAQEYRDRFVREAKAAGRLSHPGIVTVYDVSEQGGTPYLVMEFVDGRSLGSAMEVGERFTMDHIYELGQQVAEALGYAHRHGVVHRDIKPANILLAAGGPGENERAKIADLGVAKLTASQITTTGQLLGTPAFMPPEQFTGAPVDGRADLFSLGVILYWLATGDKPFAGDTITAVSYKIVHSEPAPPRRINPAVPVKLERIIMKCLEKDPAERYLTGDALAADLAAGRAGREITQGAAPALQTSSGKVVAPTPVMGGDPNTTLDSDARMQIAMDKVDATAPAVRSSASVTRAAPRRGMLPIAALALLVLLGGAITWRTIHNRRLARAAAEAQAQARQVQAQTQIAPPSIAPVTSDQNPAQTSQADQSPAGQTDGGQAASGQPGGGQSSASSTTPKGSGSSSENSPAKKPFVKPTPNRTPAKSAGSSQQPAGSNSNSSNAPPAGSQTTQLAPANSAPPSPAPANPPAPVNSTAALPPPVAKSGLSPADSAKLHIDTGRVPPATSFIVLMDGKLLFQRKALKEGEADPAKDDQIVPPGDHEFRVMIAPGGIGVGNSNSVRAAFQAKKKMTLRIELRDNSNGQTMKKSSPLNPGTATFEISLKATGILGF